MLGVAGEEIQGVGEEREDGAERAFGSARAAGEVEEEGVAGGMGDDAAEASAECGVGGVVGAGLADEFGEAGDEAVADGERGFGGDVAGGEAGAAGGEDEVGAGGGFAQGGGEVVELVGEGEGFEEMRAGGGEEVGEGGAGEVGLRAGETAVADGDDDGGAAGERSGGWHVSRIDGSTRNGAGDEKMVGPASFWSGDLQRQTQPSPWLIRHRLTTRCR
jgi:hypothetical protein